MSEYETVKQRSVLKAKALAEASQLNTGGWGCRNTRRGNIYIMIALTLMLLHILLLPLYIYLTWHHKYWSKRGLITAKPLTLLGTYPGLLTRKSNLVVEVQHIYK